MSHGEGARLLRPHGQFTSEPLWTWRFLPGQCTAHTLIFLCCLKHCRSPVQSPSLLGTCPCGENPEQKLPCGDDACLDEDTLPAEGLLVVFCHFLGRAVWGMRPRTGSLLLTHQLRAPWDRDLAWLSQAPFKTLHSPSMRFR